MMLIILDKNPFIAANKIPKRVKHTQLKELMQMLSCVVNFGYKQLPQGKELKKWIKENSIFVYHFANTLYSRCAKTQTTAIKYKCLIDLLWKLSESKKYVEPTTAILRYKEGYKCKYPTNTELPIEECIREYEKYVEWKGWE